MMPGECPHCGCDTFLDRLLRFLGAEIRRAETPRAPGPGSLTFTFVRKVDDMATAAIYRLGIPATTDTKTVGHLLVYSIDGADQPEIPVADGNEFQFAPIGARVTGSLVPVGVNGPAYNKAGDPVSFLVEDGTTTPDAEPERAVTPTFTFVRAIE